MTLLSDREHGKFLSVNNGTLYQLPVCIITDIEYFLNNEQAIRAYLLSTFDYVDISGMVIQFRTEQDMFMFLMRWS